MFGKKKTDASETHDDSQAEARTKAKTEDVTEPPKESRKQRKQRKQDEKKQDDPVEDAAKNTEVTETPRKRRASKNKDAEDSKKNKEAPKEKVKTKDVKNSDDAKGPKKDKDKSKKLKGPLVDPSGKTILEKKAVKLVEDHLGLANLKGFNKTSFLNAKFTSKSLPNWAVVTYYSYQYSVINDLIRLLKESFNKHHSVEPFVECMDAVVTDMVRYEKDVKKSKDNIEDVTKTYPETFLHELFNRMQETLVEYRSYVAIEEAASNKTFAKLIEKHNLLSRCTFIRSRIDKAQNCNDIDSWKYFMNCEILIARMEAQSQMPGTRDALQKIIDMYFKRAPGLTNGNDLTTPVDYAKDFGSFDKVRRTLLSLSEKLIEKYKSGAISPASFQEILEQVDRIPEDWRDDLKTTVSETGSTVIYKELIKTTDTGEFNKTFDELTDEETDIARHMYDCDQISAQTDAVCFKIRKSDSMDVAYTWFEKCSPETDDSSKIATTMKKRTNDLLRSSKDVDSMYVTFNDAREFKLSGNDSLINTLADLVTRAPSVATAMEWIGRSPIDVRPATKSTPVFDALLTLYEAKLTRASGTEAMIDIYNQAKDYTRDAGSDFFANIYLKNAGAHDIDRFDNDFERLKGNTLCATMSKIAENVTLDRDLDEYLLNELQAHGIKKGNAVSRVAKDLCGRLSDTFCRDGTIDHLDDAWEYIETYTYWNPNEDERFNSARCVTTLLNDVSEFHLDRKYAGTVYDLSVLASDDGAVNDPKPLETLLTAVKEFHPESNEGVCYRAALVKAIDDLLEHCGPILDLEVIASTVSAVKSRNLILTGLVTCIVQRKLPAAAGIDEASDDLTSRLMKCAIWRKNHGSIDVTNPSLYSDAPAFVQAALHLIDAEICAFDGMSGASFDATAAALELAGFAPGDLYRELAINEYEQHLFKRDFDKAANCLGKYEKNGVNLDPDMVRVMTTFAKYNSNPGNRPMLGRLVSEFEPFVKTVESQNLRAAAHYVNGMLNYTLSDWGPATDSVKAGEEDLLASTDSLMILSARFNILNANIVVRKNRSEYESLLNRALRTLRQLPQSEIVKRLQTECDNALSSTSAPAARTYGGMDTRATQQVKNVFFQDKYLVQEPEIGSGGGYKVFRATEIATNRPCAIRIPVSQSLEGKTASTALVNGFREELNIWRYLSNEVPANVVTLFGASANPFPWFACELASEDLVKGFSGLNKSDKFDVMESLLNAMEVMEQEEILHNDIKPSNIFHIDNRWELGDFDSAFYAGCSKNFKITVPFASPELMECGNNVAQNGLELTTKSDIWSAGVLFYWLMNTEQLPFAGSNEEYVRNAKNGDFIRGRSDAEYDRVYEKVFSVNPEDRPTVAEFKEMIKQLRNL